MVILERNQSHPDAQGSLLFSTGMGNIFSPEGHIELDKVSKEPWIGPVIIANGAQYACRLYQAAFSKFIVRIKGSVLFCELLGQHVANFGCRFFVDSLAKIFCLALKLERSFGAFSFLFLFSGMTSFWHSQIKNCQFVVASSDQPVCCSVPLCCQHLFHCFTYESGLCIKLDLADLLCSGGSLPFLMPELTPVCLIKH